MSEAIGLTVAMCGVTFGMFMLLSNQHVCNYRLAVLTDPRFELGENLERYGRLPPYNAMFWQLFTWEWDDTLKGTER